MGRRAILAAVTLAIAGCGVAPSGPPTTDTTSDAFATLPAKVDFLEKFVTFRRGYESLDFHIRYQNNGGGRIPGPSDWDVRLMTRIPADQLAQWIPEGIKPLGKADASWLSTIPGSTGAANITEWYVEPHRVIGIERGRNVVAYRAWAD